MKLIQIMAALLLTATTLFIQPSSATPIDSSHLAKRQCVYQNAFYDSQVGFKQSGTYVGAWTHLTNQGSSVKQGTLSYTSEPNACVYSTSSVFWQHCIC